MRMSLDRAKLITVGGLLLAAGVTVLTQRAAGLESLKLGFQVAEGKDIDWGITITLAQGTCYWIYPLIRTGGRSG